MADRIALRGRTLRQHAARGTLVNAAFLVGLSALGLLRGFILALLVSSEDYGLWGILIVSLGTLLWLKQAGIGDKYIQQSDPDQEVAFQRAFTLEMMFTGAFTLLLLAVLPIVAQIYGHPEIIAPGLLVLTVLPAMALQSPLWIHYRRMEFLRQRSLQAVDPVVGFVVTVGLAAAGAGYWAFVIGLAAGGWAAAATAVIASPYRLRWRYDRGTLRRYVSFSWPLFVMGGAGTVIAQSSVLATNQALGIAAVGALTLAATVSQFATRVDTIITGTLYPALCAVADRIDLLYESFVKSNRLALMWAMPFGFGLTLFAPDVVTFLLGDEWVPATVLLQVFGAAAAIGHIGFNWDAYFRARGVTRPMAVVSVASMVAFLAVGLPLLWSYGLDGLAAGVAAQTLVDVSGRAYYLRGLFSGLGFLRHAARAMAPTVPAIVVVLAARLAEPETRTVGIALGELIAYFAVTVVLTWRLERPLLREAVGYLRSPAAGPVAA